MFKPPPINENTPDNILLKEIKKGSQTAFIQLYDRYHKVLYVVAYKYLSEGELAKDAVQEVFTKLWEDKALLDVQTSLKNYLYAMTRNCILNAIKKNSRQILTNYETEKEQVPETDNFFEVIVQKELAQTVHTAIGLLPNKKRQICLFKLNGGYTNKEIAAKLGITENTVKKHYSQSLAILRLILQKILIYFFFVTLFSF